MQIRAPRVFCSRWWWALVLKPKRISAASRRRQQKIRNFLRLRSKSSDFRVQFTVCRGELQLKGESGVNCGGSACPELHFGRKRTSASHVARRSEMRFDLGYAGRYVSVRTDVTASDEAFCAVHDGRSSRKPRSSFTHSLPATR